MYRWQRHSLAVLRIWLQDGLAYSASGVIWVLTEVVTSGFMPFVWAAAAAGGMIRGFSISNLTMYYVAMMVCSCFITCHFMWEVAYEIREGLFTTNLVRPTSYLQFMFMRNLAWRIIRTCLFIPFFCLLPIVYSGLVSSFHLYFTPQVLLCMLLGHTLSFMSVMALAMIALVVTEAQALFELYYVPMLFLSGQLFPLSLLPHWTAALARFTPFYYTTGLPAEIMIGRVSHEDAWPLIGIQCIWILLCYGAFKVLWRYGLRNYTGVGM